MDAQEAAATNKHVLASICQQAGRHREAEALFLEVRCPRERLHAGSCNGKAPALHASLWPHTASWSCCAESGTVSWSGHTETASGARQAVAMLTQRFGEKDARTAAAMARLAEHYCVLGDYEAAEVRAASSWPVLQSQQGGCSRSRHTLLVLLPHAGAAGKACGALAGVVCEGVGCSACRARARRPGHHIHAGVLWAAPGHASRLAASGQDAWGCHGAAGSSRAGAVGGCALSSSAFWEGFQQPSCSPLLVQAALDPAARQAEAPQLC